MHLPFVAPLFTLRGIEDWAVIHKPSQIEMNDRQYAHFANLNGMNIKTVKGIPIIFSDAPPEDISRQLGRV